MNAYKRTIWQMIKYQLKLKTKCWKVRENIGSLRQNKLKSVPSSEEDEDDNTYNLFPIYIKTHLQCLKHSNNGNKS